MSQLPASLPRPLPSTAQVREVPATSSFEVTDDLIDENGHMNIGHYFQRGARAMWLRLRDLGVTQDYLQVRRLSYFTAEHHLRYLGEVRLGDRLSIHPHLLERSAKVVHALVYLVDDTHDQLSCLMEISFVHVSMDDRRAVPVADDVAAALDAEIASFAGLTWAPPVTGVMGVRRR